MNSLQLTSFKTPNSFSPSQLSRFYNIDDLERIYDKLDEVATSKQLEDTAKDISHYLAHYGITFEGRALPISLTPTIVPASEVQSVAKASLLIRQVLNRILEQFIQEHKEHRLDGPFHRFFTPYYKWWDLIANEKRSSEPIQLMRFDAVRDDHGRWSFLETNTACPGGVIHCARIRDAWRSTKLGRAVSKGEEISSFAIDDPKGFVKFLFEKANSINSDSPNIAILNFKGTYSNELASLQKCHQEMRSTRELSAGELLLGDLRNLTFSNGRAHLNGVPLALIYNKIDQLQIDPNDPEVSAWIQASQSLGTEFLNSLGSLYLAETKRTLALLSDPSWRHHLHLSPEEDIAIKNVIPFTRLIEDCVRNSDLHESVPAKKQSVFVLKADALTRGSGVTIGDQVTSEEWSQALEQTRENNGIAQLKCDLPSRKSYFVGGEQDPREISEFFGIDIFLFGNEFSGMVSRSHVNQIFNIGNGGREAPVIIVGGGL